MSETFKSYRRFARTAVSDLLRHQGEDVVRVYRNKINASASETEVSRVLAEVRTRL